MLQVLGDLLDPGVEPASQRQGPGDIFVGGVAQLRFASRPCRTQGGQQPMIDGLYSPPVDGRAADQFSANGAEGINTSGLFSHSRLIFKGKALCLYASLLQFRQVRQGFFQVLIRKAVSRRFARRSATYNEI